MVVVEAAGVVLVAGLMAVVVALVPVDVALNVVAKVTLPVRVMVVATSLLVKAVTAVTVVWRWRQQQWLRWRWQQWLW